MFGFLRFSQPIISAVLTLYPARLAAPVAFKSTRYSSTKAAASLSGAAEKYAEGIAAGASFDDIGKSVGAIKGAPRMPLVPRNAPYFTVRQCDFAVPGAAAKLMELYAEQRPGDSEPHLYAVPIIFPSDDVDLVFREQFEAWRASELHRWSEPDPNTGSLNCMRRQQATPDKSGRRRWGGRPTEVDRPCDPNDCDLFGSGNCKHVGSLNFWVPGITGAGTIELTFTSVYASLGIAETLDMVRAGLGRISGTHNGAPIFWITKMRDKVTRMDWEKGKPEKTEQYIIRLEASGLDMMQVLAGPETKPAPALPNPEHSEQPRDSIQDEPAPPVVDDSRAAKPTTTSTAEFRALRGRLSAARDRLGWDNETLGEWLVDNFGDPSVAADEKALPEVVTTLEALAADLAKRDARVAQDAPNEAAPAGQGDMAYGDSEVPF